jgi:UrcA family protein
LFIPEFSQAEIVAGTTTTHWENAMKNRTPLVALALIAASSISIARAEPPSDARWEIVRFGDLNINNSSGAEILYRRLNIAANKVCRELEPGRSLALLALHGACINAALKKALADVGNPALLAFAAAHGTIVADSSSRIAQAR